MSHEANPDAVSEMFQGAAALLGQLVSEMPPDKQRQLAVAVAGGARIEAQLTMALEGRAPAAAFYLALPDGERVRLATIDVYRKPAPATH